jgi:hypothetical protein
VIVHCRGRDYGTWPENNKRPLKMQQLWWLEQEQKKLVLPKKGKVKNMIANGSMPKVAC